MNKPIVAALASFVGWSLGTVGVSYAKHEELHLGIAISGGLIMAIAMSLREMESRKRQKRLEFFGRVINHG